MGYEVDRSGRGFGVRRGSETILVGISGGGGVLAHRYLFVGGLHRSGTSLVARLAAGLDGAVGIEGAPVPENEGVYLQGAITHDATTGRPMHFATDPFQRMTERHSLNRLETRLRMEADWDPWFARGAAWRVEKSPVNLTRMRLLQQLFPLSQFVVVIRHPEIVAAAVAKWVASPPAFLIDHWIAAHDIVHRDLDHLHSVLVLRYEDVVQSPDTILAALAAFLDTSPGAVGEPVQDGNSDYPNAPRMDAGQEMASAHWGYAREGHVDPGWRPIVRHPLRQVREAVERRCAEPWLAGTSPSPNDGLD